MHLSWLTCLAVLLLHDLGQCMKREERFNFRFRQSTMTTKFQTEGKVRHMAIDLMIGGNTIYLDGTAMKTTNFKTTQVVIGSSNSSGLVNGIGKTSRLKNPTGFSQVLGGRIFLVEHKSHCVRFLNRKTHEAKTVAGICGKAGYKDDRIRARFNFPHTIINDNQNMHNLLISDSRNRAIRQLNFVNNQVSTFFKASTDTRFEPKSITQDSESGDLYMTTFHHTVHKLGYQNKQLALLAGSLSSKRGFSDGSFAETRFSRPNEIMLYADRMKLLIADEGNNRLRILDMGTNMTSSKCSGARGHTDGVSRVCTLDAPYSLMVMGKDLFIGERGNIRGINGLSIPSSTPPKPRRTNRPANTRKPATTRKPTTKHKPTTTRKSPTESKPTTHKRTTKQKTATKRTTRRTIVTARNTRTKLLPQTTPLTVTVPKERITCVTQNLTRQLKPDQKWFRVDIGGGHVMKLQPGVHVYEKRVQNELCMGYINIMAASPPNCNTVIRQLASPQTGKAAVKLRIGKETLRLNLAIGVHKYDRTERGYLCSHTVVVIDPNILRRLEIQAEYSIKCSDVSDPIARSALMTIIEGSYNQVEGICLKDCGRPAASDPRLKCENNLLTVTWPTDVTYDGTVGVVPEGLAQKLGQRLTQQADGFLQIIIIDIKKRMSVVYPNKSSAGRSAEIRLGTTCGNDMIYDETQETCL